jgi:hypothetical protein
LGFLELKNKKMKWYFSEYSKNKYPILQEDIVVVYNFINLGTLFFIWAINENPEERTTKSFVEYVNEFNGQNYDTSRLCYSADEFEEMYPDVIPKIN